MFRGKSAFIFMGSLHGGPSVKRLPILAQKPADPYIFMAIYGIPEIFMADNNQYEYPPKKYQKWYLLPFFGTFWNFS